METSSSRKDNTVELKVTFSEAEVKDVINKKYKEYAKKYKFPGFRNGKAPRPVIDNALGKSYTLAQATDELINDTLYVAADRENLYMCSKPDFKDSGIESLKDGMPYTYKCSVEVEPVFTLKNTDPVTITMPSKAASESEIDSQINQFREHYFSYVDTKKGSKVKPDSNLTLNVKAFDDENNKIDILTSETLSYRMGTELLPKEFEDKLIGLKVGDKKKFSIKIEGSECIYARTLKGKTKSIKFDLEIAKIQEKKLPDVTDEWSKKHMGFDTVKELRSHIKSQIEKKKASSEDLLKENLAIKELVGRLDSKPTDAMIKIKKTELLKQFYGQLQQQGLTFDAYLNMYHIDQKKFDKDLEKQAQEACSGDVALEAYGRANKVEVTKSDIEDTFKDELKDNWKQAYKSWESNGELHKIKRAILQKKAAKILVDTAIIKKESESKTTKKDKSTSGKSKSKANDNKKGNSKK